MSREFHSQPFDEHTLVKLELFGRYIRSWLPVFLTKSPVTQHIKRVNLVDFFAGPGRDENGQPGSPILIVRALENFCRKHPKLRRTDVSINLRFNDKSPSKIRKLQAEVQGVKCEKNCCDIRYSTLPFEEAFPTMLPELRDKSSANLIIIDQCGVRSFDPGVFHKLVACSSTDFLSFFASSFLRRFASEAVMQERFGVSAEDVKNEDFTNTHRWFCSHFFNRFIPPEVEYFLAPFSLKKASSIYGVIFGSAKLLGLEKFLEACWGIDEKTGEANYNIDGDPFRDEQQSLFAEMNVPNKVKAFEQELLSFLSERPRDNRALYRFALEAGFLPRHAKKELKVLEKGHKVEISSLLPDRQRQCGGLYLTWDDYRSGVPRISVSVKE